LGETQKCSGHDEQEEIRTSAPGCEGSHFSNFGIAESVNENGDAKSSYFLYSVLLATFLIHEQHFLLDVQSLLIISQTYETVVQFAGA
jgi:hypothetical protein